MADKKFVGTFQNESEVLNKIDELKIQGYSDNDIYIVTNDEDRLSIVRGETDIDLRTPEGNWMDKFMAFLSGDEPVKGAFTKMGFSEDETNRYLNEVKAGGILLYVDREYGNHYGKPGLEYQAGYTDPNIGSNLIVEDYDQTNVATDVEREERLRLHEEKLNVDKERYQAGEVNVSKHVVEDTQTVEVTKRPVVNEEIIVGKREVHDTETVSESVRREEADIERTNDVLNEQVEMNRFERNELNQSINNRNRL